MTDKKVAEIFPPGEFLKEELEARNWSQVDLAEIIGSTSKVVSDLIMGKRPISPTIAKALGDAFNTSAQYWMGLESAYQLWHAKDADNVISRRAKLYQIAPIKEMIKRHWLEASENIAVFEKRVARFFEVNSINDKIKFAHVPRKSGGQEITRSQLAWLFRAKHLSKAVHAKPFSAKSFKEGLGKLKILLYETQEVRHIPKILAEAGIRFLIVEHLPQTKIDGVTFWLDEKSPVIVLSMRYDRIDWFWYTLLHELGHVNRKDGLRSDLILDIDLVGDKAILAESKSDAEKEANKFATEFLIDQSELNDFILRVSPIYGKQKIIGFAKRNKIHPGIVVGQLQFRKEIPWSSYRQMLDKVKHILTLSSLTDGWEHTPILAK